MLLTPRSDGARSLTREQFINSHAPKWGREAAAIGWWAEIIRRLSVILVVLMALALLTPGSTWIWLLSVGAVLGIADTVVFIALTRRMYRIASECLGVTIGWRSALPNRSREYEEWCTRQGIPPYSCTQ